MGDKIRIALVHEHYDPARLEKIKEEMAVLGAPTIRAVWMEVYGHFAAIEGCHRLRAAADLGIIPQIEEIAYSEDIAPGAQDDLTVAHIADSSYASVVLEWEQA